MWIQFRDEQIFFEDMISRVLKSGIDRGIADVVCTSLVVEVWSLFKQKHLGPLELEDVQRFLRFRRTSRDEDETVAIAPLLGVDARILANISTRDDRMCHFLNLLKKIPISILFMSGPRISRPGYRWAPRSFITREARYLSIGGEKPPESTQPICTEHGLRLRCRYYKLGSPFIIEYPRVRDNILIYDHKHGALWLIGVSQSPQSELKFDAILPGKNVSGSGSSGEGVALVSSGNKAEYIYAGRIILGNDGSLSSPRLLPQLSQYVGYEIAIYEVDVLTEEILIT